MRLNAFCSMVHGIASRSGLQSRDTHQGARSLESCVAEGEVTPAKEEGRKQLALLLRRSHELALTDNE